MAEILGLADLSEEVGRDPAKLYLIRSCTLDFSYKKPSGSSGLALDLSCYPVLRAVHGNTCYQRGKDQATTPTSTLADKLFVMETSA